MSEAITRKKIAEIFDDVAPYYDAMNDYLSFGAHRLWKYWFCAQFAEVQGSWVDIATGSGDILLGAMKRQIASSYYGVDPCHKMLQTAQLRLAQQGCFTPRYYRATPVTLLNLVAEDLSFFTNDSVDGLSCAFGWRNMSDKQKAVSEMSRILKPKSLCHILEFTPPTTSLPMRLYDKYLSVFLPLIGEIAYADRKSYEYLAQSIKDFWTPQECVAALEHAGLTQIKTVSVFGGIAHYYRGEKP